jgi:single-strand DNA-binding protein
LNKVIIIGRLTADPELRQTQSGISSCRFTVAVNRRIADKNTGERQADFISCTAWRQTAEFVSRYFKKGSMICVEGSLRTGSYTDRNHPDVTHYTTDVMVDNVEFCGSKSENSNTANSDFSDLSEFEEIIGDEDTPF